MRCLVCGAEMSLEQVIGQDCPPGFERRTFVCSACGDTEQRLAPVQQSEPSTPAAVVTAASVAPLCSEKEVHSALPPPPAPSCLEKNEVSAPQGVIKRIFGNLSGLYRKAGDRPSVVRDQTAQPTMPTASPREVETPNSGPKPVLTCIAPPTLPAAEHINEIDECQDLLTRAIELVRTPLHSNLEMAAASPTKSSTQEEVTSPRVTARLYEEKSASLAPAVTSSNNLSQLDLEAPALGIDVSETDSLAPPRSDRSTKLPEQGVEATCLSHGNGEVQWAASTLKTNMPAKDIPGRTPIRSVLPERRLASLIVVEIQYDPNRDRYIAKDINSGLSILRIADRQRLRQMCDRMGWQIVSPELDTAADGVIE